MAIDHLSLAAIIVSLIGLAISVWGLLRMRWR